VRVRGCRVEHQRDELGVRDASGQDVEQAVSPEHPRGGRAARPVHVDVVPAGCHTPGSGLLLLASSSGSMACWMRWRATAALRCESSYPSVAQASGVSTEASVPGIARSCWSRSCAITAGLGQIWRSGWLTFLFRWLLAVANRRD
jgi:hypothetical protein